MQVSRWKALKTGNKAVAATLSTDCRDLKENLFDLVTNEIWKERKRSRMTSRFGPVCGSAGAQSWCL